MITYRAFLREAAKFPQYNFRKYFLRRIKDKFIQQNGINTSNSANESATAQDIQQDFEQLRRMVALCKLYEDNGSSGKSTLEAGKNFPIR